MDGIVPKFDENIYSKIGLNDLVTYAVYHLSECTSEITAEDIVAACFLMFPKRFSLRGYADWPDSTVVNKRWVDCRNKRLISGNTANGFKLTPRGLEMAEKTSKVLKGERPAFSTSPTKRVRTEMRTRAGRFVKAIEDSDAYKTFEAGRTTEISEFDFRSMLLCTMESSATTLENNLQQFEQYSSLYDRKDLLGFLGFCRRKFADVLTDMTTTAAKYRGGMLKQKVRRKSNSHESSDQ